jgi:hypothetical protein
MFSGPDSWFGSKGLRRISRQTISGNSSCAITFQFSYAAGRVPEKSKKTRKICKFFALFRHLIFRKQ